MKKLLLFTLFLFLNFHSYGKAIKSTSNASLFVSIESMQVTSVSGGLNVNIETYTTTVPTYLGYTYTINQNIVNISICYYLSPLTMTMNPYHSLHIPIAPMNDYIVNLSVYSSVSSTNCDYNVLEASTSTTLDSEEFTKAANEINVFPNPSKGYFEISSEQLPVNEIKIYDLTGRLVKTSSVLKIDMTDLNEGIYTAVIATEMGTVSKKIVLKK